MSKSEFTLAIKEFQPMEFERQITLGDFVPKELRPVESEVHDGELSNSSAYTQFLDRVYYHHGEELLVEAMDEMDDLLKVFHSLRKADKFKWIKFLLNITPCLKPTYLAYLISEFKLPKPDASDKVKKNTSNFNRKVVERLTIDAIPYLADRPIEVLERQIFGLYNSIKDSTDSVKLTSDIIRDSIEAIDEKIQHGIAKVQTQSDAMTEKVMGIIDALQPVANKTGAVHSMLKTIIQNCKDHALAIAMNLGTLLFEKNYLKWSTTLITITSLVGLNKVVIDKLIDWCKPKLGYQATNTVKLLALCSTFMGKYNPVNMIGIGSAFSTIKEIKAIEELTSLFNDVAVEWGLWSSPEAELAKTVKLDVAALLQELVELEAIEANTPAMFLISSYHKRVTTGYEKVIELEKQFVQTRMVGIEGTTLVPELARLHTAFKLLNSKVTNLRRGEARRQEPVAVVYVR
jgi:hypothetical protein